MLGLAQASQYAGWWTAGGPPSVNFTAQSKLGYCVEQTPSFSIKLGESQDLSGGQVPDNGEIDVAGIGALTGANNKRSVSVVTGRLAYPSGLVPGTGNFIMAFWLTSKFWQPGFTSSGQLWSQDSFVQFRDNLIAFTGRTTANFTIYRSAVALTGSYEDYNNRWLTMIYAEAETASVFANYTGSGTGTYYSRFCVYDTETRELIVNLDLTFSPTNGFIPYLDYETGDDIVGTDGTDDADNNIGFRADAIGDQYQLEPYYANNIWAAFGSTFDPANPPDTSIFTTRPSETIGDAEAWINVQFVEANTVGNYQVLDQGRSRYSQADDYAFQWAVANADPFTTAYSTTIKPRDRNI